MSTPQTHDKQPDYLTFRCPLTVEAASEPDRKTPRFRMVAYTGGVVRMSGRHEVTAVVGGRETIAGYRENVAVSTGADMQVELRWDPVPGATYNLYRSDAPTSAVSGDEATYLLASGLTTNEHTDDGAASVDTGVPAPDGLSPLPSGTLSLWETLPVTMNEAREGTDAVVLTVPSGSASTPDRTMVYVTGGRPDSSAGADYSRTTEHAEIDTTTGSRTSTARGTT